MSSIIGEFSWLLDNNSIVIQRIASNYFDVSLFNFYLSTVIFPVF